MAAVVSTAPALANGAATETTTVPPLINGGALDTKMMHLNNTASVAPAVAPAVVPTVAPAANGGHGHGADLPYTTFHLSACSFVHPDGKPSHIRQCCAPKPPAEKAGQAKDQLIRIYHTEPSHLAYNRGCDIIRESRYNTPQGWYAAPVDDLVADDAGPGSAVASVGWWVEQEVYEVSWSDSCP